MQKYKIILLSATVLSSLCKASIHSDPIDPWDFHAKSQLRMAQTSIIASSVEQAKEYEQKLETMKRVYSPRDSVGALVHATTIVLAALPVAKTTTLPKSATTTPAKAMELQKEMQRLKEVNAELHGQAADLRADSISLQKKEDVLKELGKYFENSKFQKEDKTTHFIRSMGKVMQSIRLFEDAMDYDKAPILNFLFSEQNTIKQLEKELIRVKEDLKENLLAQKLGYEITRKKLIDNPNLLFSKKSATQFFIGVGIIPEGLARVKENPLSPKLIQKAVREKIINNPNLLFSKIEFAQPSAGIGIIPGGYGTFYLSYLKNKFMESQRVSHPYASCV